MPASLAPLRLAIIGGGISGLSTAYYLLREAPAQGRSLQIDIFERKATLGGNADTVLIDLGNYIDADGGTQPFVRWADLGVNDVNLSAYEKLKDVMTTIGYLDNMKPLQDTACYFNTAGTLALTDDSAMRLGVTDPAFSLEQADDGQLAPLVQVIHQAALDLLDSINPGYSVGYFFDSCVERPQAMLAGAAAQLGIMIDWLDPQLPARAARVRDQIYYPRIAAMYFTDNRGPQFLPLQSPFEYYRLQEGGSPPDRRYFDHGAQTWLEALATYLLQHATPQVRIAIHTQAEVKVQAGTDGVLLLNGDHAPEYYDLCVLATHADDTLKLLDFSPAASGAGADLKKVLASVNYTHSYAVCHTYAGLLPPNRNLWRTYNVLQRDPGDSLFPYRMSYVENLHQNDPANPDYNKAGLPTFFVSLVDTLNAIPRDAMLDRLSDPSRVDPALLAQLPKATLRQLHGEAVLTGYRSETHPLHQQLADKAWTIFKHNVLDADCLVAQQAINQYNSHTAGQLAHHEPLECALLFGGGWTHGAGLQEQCLQQSAKLAGWILPALSAPAAVPANADAAAA
jgi:predicted NAD/FAD-dependent oxidoreductase